MPDGWRVRRRRRRTASASIHADHVISSRADARAGRPHPAAARLAAQTAIDLAYRDFLTVALIKIRSADLFPDNWIYIHDPKVKVGRIQNFRSWSPEMVPDPELACVGLEYFCFEGDGLWTSTDDDLIALATREMGLLGLCDRRAPSRAASSCGRRRPIRSMTTPMPPT